jgi:lipid-A-disaccharide synthase
MSGPAKRIGIIAGSGSLPIEVAESVVRRGGNVHIVMVDGAADPALKAFPHSLVNWAQPGRASAALKRAGIRDVLLLGAFRRPSLREARPDFAFLRGLPGIVRLLRSGGDDAALRGVLALFEGQGLNIVGVRDVAPELLIEQGVVTKESPRSAEVSDIAAGFALIAALGRYDIGQAAVVSGGRIEAIEGAEGTDGMLRRVAATRGPCDHAKGGVLVKLPKPGQDLRVDLPAIGPNTVKNAADAGLAGIAVMAGHVLAAERAQMIAEADRRGLFIIGIESELRHPGRGTSNIRPTVALGTFEVPSNAGSDISRARSILATLAEFDTGSAVVIDAGRVFAIGADEPARDVIRRATLLRGRRSRRSGVAVVNSSPVDEPLLLAANACKLSGVVHLGPSSDCASISAAVAAADRLEMFLAVAAANPGSTIQIGAGPITPPRDLSIFLVAGEHSGDALGAKLMAALRRYHAGVRFAGVGGEEMAREGLRSLFPIEDVAVMGPMSILPRLPRIIRRVGQTVDAALAAAPDAVVIIDSPEFTHPIARRIRRRAPDIPIIDYVSPSVWAWRPGRAKRMRRYIDHVLALLPFEPEAHARLGGPPCTYVGHPLIERYDEIQTADGAALASRLGLSPGRPVMLVLPGSRISEVDRLIDVFGETVRRVYASTGPLEVIIPAVAHVRNLIEARTEAWIPKPHIVDAASPDKYAAMRLARAALAASGTVTLELALAETPSVVAYKVERWVAPLRFLIKVPSVVLANLVLGRNVYPEFLQEDCTPEKLEAAVLPLLSDTDARRVQLEGLKQTAEKLRLASSSPSTAAAEAVLATLSIHAGKSRRGGPT